MASSSSSAGMALPPPRSTGTSVSPRLVVALDYGTTNTGIGWMLINSTQGRDMNDLNIYEDWPSGVTTKVPSAISFSKTMNGKLQWGHDIDSDSDVLRWTKLELQQRSKLAELQQLRDTVRGLRMMAEFRANPMAGAEQDVPEHLGLDAEDIVADYLRKVVRRWLGHMQTDSQSVLTNVPLDLVITHPGVWSYEARNKTLRAALRAFDRKWFPTLRDVSLCNEPEACALYTALSATSRDRGRLQPEDCFVVCDAGGGTVDLLAYKMESKAPFEITTLTRPASVHAGATQIDRAFMEFLGGVIEDLDVDPNDLGVGGHYVLKPVVEHLLRRFIQIKHVFGGDELKNEIPLPRNCRVRATPYAQSKVKNRTLLLTNEDLEAMFKPTVDMILNYIAKQVAQVKAQRKDVTHIFMSGGFSDSPYLFGKVQNWARMKAIEVERGNEDSWGAVVRGAVLKGAGIGSSQPTKVRICPRSYGITLSQKFAAHLPHEEHDMFKDKLHGQVMARNQIAWLVRKGDLIPADEPVVATYNLTCNFTSSDANAGKFTRVSLVATTSDSRVTRLSDLDLKTDEVIHLDYQYSKIPTSERHVQKKAGSSWTTFYSAPTKVELTVDTAVVMRVICGSEVMVENRTTL